MNNKNILRIILVVLCLHLMYTNADLLIINSKLQETINWFQTFLLGLFGLSYSILTAVAIYKIKKIGIIIPFAILDGFAVWLRMSHEINNFILLSSLFYGFYTCYIVVISFVLSKQEQNEKQKQNEEQKQNQNEITKQKQNELENKIKEQQKQIEILIEKQNQNENQKQNKEEEKQNEITKTNQNQNENQKTKTKQIKIDFDNLTEEETQEFKSKIKALNRVKDKDSYIENIENPKVKNLIIERYASNTTT